MKLQIKHNLHWRKVLQIIFNWLFRGEIITEHDVTITGIDERFVSFSGDAIPNHLEGME